MNAFSTRAPFAAAPASAAALLARARTLIASGRPDAARPLLGAVRRLGEDEGDVDALEAQLLMQGGRLAEALALLDAAIGRAPGAAAMRLLRAHARLLADDPKGAAEDAAEAVLSEPGNATAKAALGIALADFGCLDDAIACLAEAMRAEPANSGFRLALARAQELAGDTRAARATLDDGIARAPHSLALRNAAVRLAVGLGDFPLAVALAEAARRAGVLDAVLFGLLGHALSSLGRHADAGEAYAEALKLAPEDAYVRHMVAASGLLPAAAQAPDDYVRVLFDGYARHFDQHLLGLGYRVPGLLRAAALAHLALPEHGVLGPVLDLGCGTGLAAVAMSDLALGPWHGLDLSPAMLRRARATGLYETLHESSMEAMLAQPGPGYALAVAADVFCYAGGLQPLFVAVRRRLLPGALLLASFETLPAGSGWRLGPRGRYAHAPDHVAEIAAASGFTVRALTAEAQRMEEGAPVEGMIVVLAKASQ